MAEVDRRRSGPYAAWARQLLTELANARQCLLHPQRKAEYDAWLRQSAAPGPPTPPPAIIPPPVHTGPVRSSPPPTASVPAAKHREFQGASWAVALLTFALLVLLGAIAFTMHHRQRQAELASTMVPEMPVAPQPAPASEPAVVDQADRSEPHGTQPAIEPVARAEKITPGPQPLPEPPVKPEIRSTGPPIPTPEPMPVAERKPETKVEPKPEVKPQAKAESKAESKPQPEPKPEVKAESKAEPKPEAKVVPNPKPAVGPVPAEAEVLKAQIEVRRKYREELAADEPEAKVESTRKLVALALAETTDRATQYVLFSESLDLSVDAGAVRIFTQITKLVADRFAVDPLRLKAERLSQNARRTRSAEANQSLAKVALEVAAEAVATEKYTEAVRLGEAAREMARRAKDAAKLKQATVVLRDAIARQEAQASDQKAVDVLASQPGDPRANLMRGKYLCFMKGDWTTGLSHLEKGSDPVLQRLAAAERQTPATAVQMVALADQWWDALKLLDESTQTHAKIRAGEWYRKALPELTGQAKSRAKKRLDEVEELAGGGHK
jgi:hypothetical protein